MPEVLERPLKFRTFDARISGAVIADAPDPQRLYRESSLAEHLELDLRNATLILEPSYYCDLRCGFCALPVTSRTALDWDRLAAVLQAFAICGLKRVTLTGGEPGIFRRLTRILADLKAWGFTVDMLTHGLWAANDAYLDKLLAEGVLLGITVSLKALDPVAFTAVTSRRTHFNKQLRALENLARAVADGRLSLWTINHVLTRQTIDSFEELEWLNRFASSPQLTFSLVEPYLPEMCALVPEPHRLRQVVSRLHAALTKRGIVHHFEGFPLCVLDEAAGRSLDPPRQSDRRTRIVVQPRADADYVLSYSGYQRLRQFGKLAGCKECALSELCPGVHVRMMQDWSPALSPVPRAEV